MLEEIEQQKPMQAEHNNDDEEWTYLQNVIDAQTNISGKSEDCAVQTLSCATSPKNEKSRNLH